MKIGPLAILVASYVVIHPDEYTFVEVHDRQDLRSRTGALFTYIVKPQYRRYEMTLSWVSSLNRSLISSWHATGADLVMYEMDDPDIRVADGTWTAVGSITASGNVSPSVLVRISGYEEPLNTYVEPYFREYYAGSLTLETISPLTAAHL